MKFLTSGEQLLIEEALESLHQQSTDWLSQLDLWKDEKVIYHDMISNKLFQTSLKDQQNVAKMLDEIEGSEIDALYKDILSHEKFLKTALLASNKEDRWYREIHDQLLVRYNKLGDRTKSLRRGVLNLMKLVNENFFNKNETLSIIAERRAVRKYKMQSIDKGLIEQVLKAACMAPSAINSQPWKFYVVTDKEKIRKYDSETLKAADKVHHKLMGHLKTENPIYHGAPVVIFITGPKVNEWAPIDIGLCAQNLMLAAKSLGLDTCPIGLAQYITTSPVYPELKISETEKIFLAITLGYGDEKPEMHERKKNNVIFLT